MKLNKYFYLQEFVPKQIWTKYGEKSIWFVDERVITLALAYREFFDVPIIINNWHTGGEYMYRGYRPPRVNIGAEYSQHKFGRAFDCSTATLTATQMLERIKADWTYFKSLGLTTIENPNFTPGWLHSDCRPKIQEELLIVNP